MKQSILNNWNFVRVLRLVVGLAILVQAIMGKDWLFGIAGVLFTGMALLNVGCCTANGCATRQTTETSGSDNAKKVSYEEVV